MWIALNKKPSSWNPHPRVGYQSQLAAEMNLRHAVPCGQGREAQGLEETASGHPESKVPPLDSVQGGFDPHLAGEDRLAGLCLFFGVKPSPHRSDQILKQALEGRKKERKGSYHSDHLSCVKQEGGGVAYLTGLL